MKMRVEVEIKSCPFCQQDERLQIKGTGHLQVECIGCGAEGPVAPTPFEAVSLWNLAAERREGRTSS